MAWAWWIALKQIALGKSIGTILLDEAIFLTSRASSNEVWPSSLMPTAEAETVCHWPRLWGSLNKESQKQGTAHILLPNATRLMSTSKPQWTIDEHVDKIQIRDQIFTWLLKRHQQTNLAILMMMMHAITHTLTTNGPCLGEQQGALLSDSLVRLADFILVRTPGVGGDMALWLSLWSAQLGTCTYMLAT